MPSFLSDESGPVVPNPAFQPLAELRQPHEKTNGNTRPARRRSARGSFDQSLDQYLDDILEGKPLANGEMHNDAGLTSIPIGRSSASSRENKASQNGSLISDNGAVNGISENGTKGPVPSQNGFSKATSTGGNCVASMNGGPVQYPGAESSPSKSTASSVETGHLRRISLPPPLSTNPQSTGPLTYQSSLVPATPDTPGRSPSSSSQWFSVPPVHPSSATPTTPTFPAFSSSNHPIHPPLKHRHTLQVPRVGPSRSSTEDTGFSSGRFSPTSASGPRRASVSIIRRTTRSIHSDLPHEEIQPDEDAIRWAEAIRQKRASKRRRKDDEDDDRVVVGTKVDQNHVNWVTAYNMLTGIRFTVSRTNAKLDRPLTAADFVAKHKFSFDMQVENFPLHNCHDTNLSSTGNELTPSAKYDFKFKDYAPWVFRNLRMSFKLDPGDYLMSLTSKYILSELGSPGKSGSFFYFSRDYKYIIKTIHHSEHKFLRKILKDYYNHVQDNPNTLLSQFYGLHRVKIPYGRKIHFVVMNNLFPPHRDIHQTFDLKGSTIGRNFKEEDLERNPRATLKDLNWLRRNLHLEFGPEKKRLFLEQMEKDVHLLQKLKIMDYSMLIGIHDLEKGNQENLRDKTLRVFQPGGDMSPDDVAAPGFPVLTRTPSKLESARKARELRQIIQQEIPRPMDQTLLRMAEQMEENILKREFTFYSDDGGFQATHDDNRPGDEIYYLGIIDCLTHYGTVKRLENIWKGLSHDKSLISPIPSVPYGDRFIKFMMGVTMTREEAEREAAGKSTEATGMRSTESARRQGTRSVSRTTTENSVIQMAENQAHRTEKRGANEESVPDRTISTIRTSSGEHPNDRAGMTLPIVDEVGESSSTGGKSRRSTPEHEETEDRPPTPPKDRGRDKGSMALPNDSHSRGSSFDMDKALPPLPRTMSPEQMDEKQSIVV